MFLLEIHEYQLQVWQKHRSVAISSPAPPRVRQPSRANVIEICTPRNMRGLENFFVGAGATETMIRLRQTGAGIRDGSAQQIANLSSSAKCIPLKTIPVLIFRC